MAVGASLQLFHQVGVVKKFGRSDEFKSSEMKSWHHLPSISLSSCALRQDVWGIHTTDYIYRPIVYMPHKYSALICRSFCLPVPLQEIPLLNSLALNQSYKTLVASPSALQLVPAIGVIAFAAWGLIPLMRSIRSIFHHDGNWKKSRTYYISTSYLQPMLLWSGATFICRALDPLVLPSEASQVVKLRLLNFVRSLSTVLAFAYCLSSM